MSRLPRRAASRRDRGALVHREREHAISQIAEAFIVPSAAMTQAVACCDRGDQRGMRSVLAPYEFEAFAWSGYVIVVLVEWLREHAIHLPRNRGPAVQALLAAHDPLLCGDAAEVAALAARLEGLTPSSDELSRESRRRESKAEHRAHRHIAPARTERQLDSCAGDANRPRRAAKRSVENSGLSFRFRRGRWRE
jgi:hypothetical protein